MSRVISVYLKNISICSFKNHIFTFLIVAYVGNNVCVRSVQRNTNQYKLK